MEGIVNKLIKEENEILKKIRREIVKSAKRGDLHYYWDVTGLNSSLVKSVVYQLESEGKNVNNKGLNYKVIRW